jgi:hypothetical protein
MEKYTTGRRLNSYSVNYQLIRSLEDFITQKIPPILYSGRFVPDLSPYTTLTLVRPREGSIYRPIRAYNQPLFDNDVQVARIELSYKDPGSSIYSKAIVLVLRLGKSSDDNNWSIALQDDKPAEKARIIEQGLLEVLKPYENRNQVTYPNEFIPTLVFVAGFFSGAGSFLFTDLFLRSLCILLSGAAVYFLAHRFTNGYCSFESKRQQQLDLVLKLFTGALALFVLIVLLSPLVKR